ncbi:MAG TPA: hypothetical protein ENN60_00425 [archaeon]|nr:hypothetical protein [archaeon]
MNFATAGIPLECSGMGSEEGVRCVRKLGLDGMELEFVRGVNMGLELAGRVGRVARELDVVLTAHGPYYINLLSKERAKREASVKRVLDTARVAVAAGAWSITYHAAYYQGLGKEKAYQQVRKLTKEIVETLQREGVKIWVRPETTGKATQWGDLEEIVKLSRDVEGVLPCVDFSHLHARTAGKFNSKSEWEGVMKKLEDGLGKEALKNMHIHLSGINYGQKGELNHLVLADSDLKWQDLLEVLRDFGCCGVVVCESPNIEGDALLMKGFWESMS